MPTIKHLLEELKLLNVKPEDVRITGKMFDNIMIDIEEQKGKAEDEPEENPDN
ncbi:MAG: hypothetical protein WC455_03440 [Dehalococcoidia bacterium]|jgi:hypothetical protein